MSAGLTIKPLKRLTEINREVLSESTPEDFEIEYVDISNVSGMGRILGTETLLFGKAPSRARRLVQNGDTIISTVRTYLRAITSIQSPPPNLVVSTGFATLTPGPEIDGGYFAYLAQTEHFIHEVVSRSTGVSYPAITPSELGNIKISYPPLPAQRRIAAYLDCETAQIDALVAEKEALLGLLEEKRASLISHAVTRGLPAPQSRQAGLNPKAKLKPSGIPWLGDVPVHWELVPLSSVISYLSYGFTNPMPSFHDGEGVPLLTANDIGEGTVKFETARKTTREAFSALTGKCRPLKDDILITKDGTLGRIAVSDGTECCINQSVALLRINPAKANIHFVAIALAARAYQDRMIFEAGGTTIKHIYITRLAKMTFTLPPKSEQNTLVTYGMNSLAAIDSLLGSVNESIHLLREKRSSLISAAVTGEMAVP